MFSILARLEVLIADVKRVYNLTEKIEQVWNFMPSPTIEDDKSKGIKVFEKFMGQKQRMSYEEVIVYSQILTHVEDRKKIASKALPGDPKLPMPTSKLTADQKPPP